MVCVTIYAKVTWTKDKCPVGKEALNILADKILQPPALSRIVEWRRHLHAYPEVSGQEYETRRYLLDELAKMGIPARTFECHAGIMATVEGCAPGGVIALRADMDALPLEEKNAVGYRSQRQGIMHACGHDGHMAILLGVASALQQSRDKWAGTVKLLFQPSEEDAPRGGAPKMIKDGVLENPKVDAIFGLHVWPELPCGDIGIIRGPQMASSDRFSLRLIGASAHAANPHQGIDAIMMAGDVLNAFSRIIHRRVDPREAVTISVGTIRGGERYNVVAGEVLLEGTVRTLSEAIRKQIPAIIRQVTEGICAGYGGSFELDYQHGYPVLNNTDDEACLVVLTAGRLLGSERVRTDIKPALGAEDFAFYTDSVPGAFFLLGCGADGGKLRPLHSGNFDFDERALFIGARIMEDTVLAALSRVQQRKGATAKESR